MKKHVLILGGSLMQKPAVEAARNLGCRITLVDANPDVLCRTFADSFECIDLKDTDKICAFAQYLHKNKGLHAVFTAGTDFSYAVSRAAEACALPAHNAEAALNASDKIRMRSCFKQAGVPSPRFVQADFETSCLKLSDLQIFLKLYKLEFPLVVKPCDNMGGRACRRTESVEELASALAEAVLHSKTKRAIIEEYMDGPEFSIDSLVYNGTLTVTGFADRHIYFPPYFIETGHTIPSNADETVRTALFKTFAQGVKALGLSCGAAKADIKMTSKGPMIGEIAARLSGGYMSGWTYPYASDFDLTREALRIALGETPDELLKQRTQISVNESALALFEVSCKRHCAERAWISVPGKIKETLFFTEAEKMPAVRNFFPRLGINDTADFPHNNVEKAGNAIAVGEEYIQSAAFAAASVKTVFLRLEPRNVLTERFLSQELDTAFPPSAFKLPPAVSEILQTYVFPESTRVRLIEKMHIALLPVLEPYAGITDWNGRSLAETVELYNRLYNSQADFRKSIENCISLSFSEKMFWHCLLRGGIQGAVYYFDSCRGDCL